MFKSVDHLNGSSGFVLKLNDILQKSIKNPSGIPGGFFIFSHL